MDKSSGGTTAFADITSCISSSIKPFYQEISICNQITYLYVQICKLLLQPLHVCTYVYMCIWICITQTHTYMHAYMTIFAKICIVCSCMTYCSLFTTTRCSRCSIIVHAQINQDYQPWYNCNRLNLI